MGALYRYPSATDVSPARSPRRRGNQPPWPQRRLFPGRAPGREVQTTGFDDGFDFIDKRLTHLVIIATFEAEFAIQCIVGGVRPTEDVHGANKPPLEGFLRFFAGGRVLGEATYPQLTVRHMPLLLGENLPDGAAPGTIARRAHILQLMAGPPIHTEIEHHEVGPGLQRVVKDVHAQILPPPLGDDIRLRIGQAPGEFAVMLPYALIHIDAEIA